MVELYSTQTKDTPDQITSNIKRFEQLTSSIAKKLADAQEAWALKEGFNAIVLKTRNRFTGMLLFAINNGFGLDSLEQKDTIEDYRIILRKKLIIQNI